MTQLQAQVVLPSNFDEELQARIRQTVIEVLRDMPVQSASKPEFYNIGAAAQAAGVARNTLKKWINEGLPVVIVGGVKRVKRTDLEKFMEGGKI